MMKSKSSNNALTEEVIDWIADRIADHGYVLLEQFLPIQLAQELYQEAEALSVTAFKKASIGRNIDKKLDSQIRSDTSLWLSDLSFVQSSYIHVMEQLQEGINKRLYMGLSEFECHFSHYQQGDFYLRHLDAFKTKPRIMQKNRKLSSVYYLNENWCAGDGGELALYSNEELEEPLLKVKPLFNQCIIFLSDTFPHEVLVSNKDRYSIAGWFR